MIKLFQQSIYELYVDLMKIDKKIFAILFGILLAVLLLQMMKMTRYGKLYTPNIEGFEDENTDTSDEDVAKNKNEAEIKAIESLVKGNIQKNNETMASLLDTLNVNYQTIFPDDDDDTLQTNVEKLYALDEYLCLKNKYSVFQKYYDIISELKKIVTGNGNDINSINRLHSRLQKFNEIEFIDDFVNKYPTIQEQQNTANRLRFMVEDLSLEDLKEQNFLTKCSSTNAVAKVTDLFA